MAKDDDILDRIRSGRGAIPYRDIERVVRKLGFERVRQSGSHRIYRHPKVPRPLNIQPIGNEAKAYQVKQLRDIIEEFNLTFED